MISVLARCARRWVSACCKRSARAMARYAVWALAFSVLTAAMFAQSAPQPVPQPPLSSLTRIETEVVTIHGQSAVPSSITRPAGKFFLLLINKTRAPLSLTFDSPTLAATICPIPKLIVRVRFPSRGSSKIPVFRACSDYDPKIVSRTRATTSCAVPASSGRG